MSSSVIPDNKNWIPANYCGEESRVLFQADPHAWRNRREKSWIPDQVEDDSGDSIFMPMKNDSRAVVVLDRLFPKA